MRDEIGVRGEMCVMCMSSVRGEVYVMPLSGEVCVCVYIYYVLYIWYISMSDIYIMYGHIYVLCVCFVYIVSALCDIRM